MKSGTAADVKWQVPLLSVTWHSLFLPLFLLLAVGVGVSLCVNGQASGVSGSFCKHLAKLLIKDDYDKDGCSYNTHSSGNLMGTWKH